MKYFLFFLFKIFLNLSIKGYCLVELNSIFPFSINSIVKVLREMFSFVFIFVL